MLEFGSRTEFDDPKLQYRRLFSELLGTFMLVLVAAGGGILHAKGQISLAAAVVAPGLMVLAIILFMGAVSGAHLNPAVSLAFAVRGDFRWRRVPGYIIVQLVGATLACLFLLAVFGNVEHLGATLPGPGYHNWQAFLMEIALTAGLLSVILGTASAAQNVGRIGALGVGGYIALAGLWAAPVSGTSMNPARSFGPALVSGDWTAYWVYVAGPLIGAAIAVGCAIILRGRGGDPISHAAGSGVLDPGPLGGEKQALAGDRRRQGRAARARSDERTRGLVTRDSRHLMCVNAEETHGVVNDEVSGGATVRSHRAADSFAGLPIARAALKFASARHASQYRETDHAPFIAHPIEVGSLLHSDGQPDEVIAAGLLHDLLEKTGTTRAELQRRFGASIARLVESVSDDPSIDDYGSRKRELRDRVAHAGSNTVAIFAADKISKVRELSAAANLAPGRHHDPRQTRPLPGEPQDAPQSCREQRPRRSS